MFSTDEGDIVLTIRAVPNEALLLRIYRYGPDMIIKSPESMRRDMAKMIRSVIALYNDDE